MSLRFFKIVTILISFIFLTGFFPIFALLGPSFTVATSGNIYKAGTQYVLSKTMRSKDGKNSLSIVNEKIYKKNNNKDLNLELKQLVEKRIKLVRMKLNLKSINQ
jgi:hypothetical protein